MSFISANSVNVANFSSIAPKEWAQGNIKFWHIYMNYNYGTPQEPQIGGALFELQITKAWVKRKVNPENQKEDWKLIVTLSDPSDVEACKRIDLALKQAIYEHRVRLLSPNFTVESDKGYRGIYFMPTDRTTGEIIESSNPLMAMKITAQSRFGIVLDQNGNTMPIDYHQLENKELTACIIFAPRVFRQEGPNKECFGQAVVRSCTILSMTDVSYVDHTKSNALKAYLAQNPDVISALSEEVERIKSQPPPPPVGQPAPSGQVLFSASSSEPSQLNVSQFTPSPQEQINMSVPKIAEQPKEQSVLTYQIQGEHTTATHQVPKEQINFPTGSITYPTPKGQPAQLSIENYLPTQNPNIVLRHA